MNEKSWKKTANIAGILSLVSIGLFLFKLLMGSINFWTILFFSLIVTGAIGYVVIHILLKMRNLTPAEESVADQVSDTKEFVGFFISVLFLIATAVGMEFFSRATIGKTLGALLFVYTIATVVAKVYDIQRLTSAKKKRITLIKKHNFKQLSRAEQIGLGIAVIGLVGMFWIPKMSCLIYMGLMVFMIRLVTNRVQGRVVDGFLMKVNLIMVLVSLILAGIK